MSRMLLKDLVPEGWSTEDLVNEIMNETPKIENLDPFFYKGEESLLSCLIHYLDSRVAEDLRTVANLVMVLDDVKLNHLSNDENAPDEFIKVLLSEVPEGDDLETCHLMFNQFRRYVINPEDKVRVAASLIDRVLHFQKLAIL